MSATGSAERRRSPSALATGHTAAWATTAAIALSVVAFPLALGWSARAGMPWLGSAAAIAVCVALLLALGARRLGAALAIGVAGAAAGAVLFGVPSHALAELARAFVYAPSVLVLLAIASVFARSLRPGRTALLTRLASRARGALPPAVTSYTRSLTWMWALLLAGLALVSALLAIFATYDAWSLFANGLIYTIVAVVFVGEFFFRRWWLRSVHHPGFMDYLRFLRRTRGTAAETRDAG